MLLIDQSPAVRLPAETSDRQLEKLYYKTIRELQQIKEDLAYREEYLRLELYRKYPHPGEEEVDTFWGLCSEGIQAWSNNWR